MKKCIIYILIILILIGLFIIIYNNKDEEESEILKANYTEEDFDDSWDNNATDINLDNKSGKIEITNGGTYHITGTLNDGYLYVDTSDQVKLVLDNVNISSSNYAAIMIENAAKTIITLAKSSDNYLKDGTNYNLTTTEDEPNRALFSKDNLTINGSGSLNITASYEDGIVSKDGLIIVSGDIKIIANDDGIRGKDYVNIYDAKINIKSGSNAIKTTNTTDKNLGYILIENGTFNIKATGDAIQAASNLQINNGTFNIETGGGSDIASSIHNSWGMWDSSTSNFDNSSAKGLKAENSLVLNSGTYNLDTSDDSIHSNNNIEINDGNYTISSGDDGIHGDTKLTINNGTITINKSYEGLESSDITINNGNISITSSDDGINVAGGKDSSSMNGRPGENKLSSASGSLNINGGSIIVDASGDGLDANGNIYMKQGKVIIYGPIDNANSSIDYDGKFQIDGGVLIATGPSGMLQMSSSSSSINTIIATFSNKNADTTITVSDDIEEILNITPPKSYSSLIFASANIVTDKTYNINCSNTSLTVTIEDTITTTGIKNNNTNKMGGMIPEKR